MNLKYLPFLAIVTLGIGLSLGIATAVMSQEKPKEAPSQDETKNHQQTANSGYELPHFIPTVRAAW